MSAMTKVFVVLNAVLSIVLSVFVVGFAAQSQNWKSLAMAYQTDRDAAITTEQAVAAGQFASVALKDETISSQAADIKRLQQEKQDLVDQLNKTNNEFTTVKNEKVASEAGRTSLQQMLDTKMAETAAVRAQNDQLRTTNIDTQTRNNQLNARNLELTTNVTILQDENRNLQEKLYAAQQMNTAAKTASAATPAPGTVNAVPSVAGTIKGEVTTVDGTYASIDVGEASGVQPGMTFMVSRGTTYLGDLVIERVRPKEASGKLTMLAAAEIRRGDRVSNNVEN